MRGEWVIVPVSLEDYLVVFLRRNLGKGQNFVLTLQRVGPPMGMRVRNPKMIELPTDKTDVLLERISLVTLNMHNFTQLVGYNAWL